MSTENEASIKVIVELHAKPGRRTELRNLLECVAGEYGSGEPGFLGSTATRCLITPTSWLRSQIGYPSKCGQQPCSKP